MVHTQPWQPGPRLPWLPPSLPRPSGAGKAFADPARSHQPDRGQGGVTQALGFLLCLQAQETRLEPSPDLRAKGGCRRPVMKARCWAGSWQQAGEQGLRPPGPH